MKCEEWRRRLEKNGSRWASILVFIAAVLYSCQMIGVFMTAVITLNFATLHKKFSIMERKLKNLKRKSEGEESNVYGVQQTHKQENF